MGVKSQIFFVAVLCILILASQEIRAEESGNNVFFPFEHYKSNYLIWKPGHPDNTDLKFQVSIKYRIFREGKGWRDNWLPLYFAYTQKGYWGIGKTSAPFEEINFNPELFLSYDIKKLNWGKLKLRDVQAGLFEHESTGVAGGNSRGWNRSYIMPTLVYEPFGLRSSLNPLNIEPRFTLFKGEPTFSLGLKLWHIWELPDENRDIADFLGHGEVVLKAATQTEMLSVTARKGEKRGLTVQIDVTSADFIVRRVLDVNFSWHFQYFNGYGDGLVKYNVKDVNMRFGVLFTL